MKQGKIQNTDVVCGKNIRVGFAGFQTTESPAQVEKGALGPAALIETLQNLAEKPETLEMLLRKQNRYGNAACKYIYYRGNELGCNSKILLMYYKAKK